MSEESGLLVEQLSVTLGALPILAGVGLTVRPGEVVAVIGPNGAGKTTLLNAVSGYVSTQGGMVTLFGRRIEQLPAWQRARLGVGRTFQDPTLWQRLPVYEQLLLAQHTRCRPRSWSALADLAGGASLPRERAARTRASAVLDRLGLQHAAQLPSGLLSRGQSKRLDLARCLAQGARLLLLDEPSGGLQGSELAALGTLIVELAAGDEAPAIVLVEHNLVLVRAVASRVVVLDRGSLLFAGSVEAAWADPLVQAAYLGVPAGDA